MLAGAMLFPHLGDMLAKVVEVKVRKDGAHLTSLVEVDELGQCCVPRTIAKIGPRAVPSFASTSRIPATTEAPLERHAGPVTLGQHHTTSQVSSDQ